jgi:hypothetical protein
MPCPNAPQAYPRHPAKRALQMFRLYFPIRDNGDDGADVIITFGLGKSHDPAKFLRRARHAVPLLQPTPVALMTNSKFSRHRPRRQAVMKMTPVPQIWYWRGVAKQGNQRTRS